jgi:hypothetical protein
MDFVVVRTKINKNKIVIFFLLCLGLGTGTEVRPCRSSRTAQESHYNIQTHALFIPFKLFIRINRNPYQHPQILQIAN